MLNLMGKKIFKIFPKNSCLSGKQQDWAELNSQLYATSKEETSKGSVTETELLLVVRLSGCQSEKYQSLLI